MPFTRKLIKLLPLCLILLVLSTIGHAQEGEDIAELLDLSLEDLMDIEITSLSKKEEHLFEAASAIHVITQRDLHRWGASSIPEALRMVPGLQVAHLDANKWAVTARGFNGRFANKLLVLIDGRSVYTPLYSGVFWESQDLVMENIERIEIIRGPGGSLWGANAVNGIINIITKRAEETRGNLVVAGYGTEMPGVSVVQHGGSLGENAHYRAHVKYFERDAFAVAEGKTAADAWDAVQAGFRLDWDGPGTNTLSLQGNIHESHLGQTYALSTSLTEPYVWIGDTESRNTVGYALTRWEHTFSHASDMAVQLYYDRFERDDLVFSIRQNTYDFDFQHHFPLAGGQEAMWGIGCRYIDDEIEGSFQNYFSPDTRRDRQISAFLQDNVTLPNNRIHVTVGSKFMHNDYTGFEIQPSLKVRAKIRPECITWMAVSRAVRVPSRSEHDIRFASAIFPPRRFSQFAPTTLVILEGNRDFKSEVVTAYEFGHRLRPAATTQIDIALFYNAYTKLRSIEVGTLFLEWSPPPLHLVVPLNPDTKLAGQTYGIEAAAQWKVLDPWHLQLAYTHLEMDLWPKDGSSDSVSVAAEDASARNSLAIWSMLDLRTRVELDLGLRYVDVIPALKVKSYLELDVHLGWSPVADIELSLVGRNLLRKQHPEYVPSYLESVPTQVQRSVYGEAQFRF